MVKNGVAEASQGTTDYRGIMSGMQAREAIATHYTRVEVF